MTNLFENSAVLVASSSNPVEMTYFLSLGKYQLRHRYNLYFFGGARGYAGNRKGGMEVHT